MTVAHAPLRLFPVGSPLKGPKMQPRDVPSPAIKARNCLDQNSGAKNAPTLNAKNLMLRSNPKP